MSSARGLNQTGNDLGLGDKLAPFALHDGIQIPKYLTTLPIN